MESASKREGAPLFRTPIESPFKKGRNNDDDDENVLKGIGRLFDTPTTTPDRKKRNRKRNRPTSPEPTDIQTPSPGKRDFPSDQNENRASASPAGPQGRKMYTRSMALADGNGPVLAPAMDFAQVRSLVFLTRLN